MGRLILVLGFLIANSHAFADNLLEVHFSQATPEHNARDFLIADRIMPAIKYTYVSKGSAEFAMRAGYKGFLRKTDFQPTTIFFVGQNLGLTARVYHPLYFHLGLSFMLLRPISTVTDFSESGVFPQEWGASVQTHLRYWLTQSHYLSVSFERWRGIDSTSLQGAEWGIGFGTRF